MIRTANGTTQKDLAECIASCGDAGRSDRAAVTALDDPLQTFGGVEAEFQGMP